MIVVQSIVAAVKYPRRRFDHHQQRLKLQLQRLARAKHNNDVFQEDS
jgi:hypothetical protein